MEQSPKYYIVEASALPEIFQKVAEAKRMLETGETDKVNVAAQAVGISRSAFYKYRDSIAPFQNLMAGRIITFQMMLKDKAGVLSEILAIFANCGANILTINQSIPTGGRAMVTISAETSNLSCTLEALTQKIADVLIQSLKNKTTTIQQIEAEYAIKPEQRQRITDAAMA